MTATSAVVVTSALLWLNHLQETDRVQVGDQILSLQQIWRANYPVQLGFVVPDAAMQLFWQKINWDDAILKDFPYLSLNFSFSQATQVQFMAQTLQQGILNTPFDIDWTATWSAALGHWDEQGLLLTPYVWATQDAVSSAASVAEMLFLTPLVCDRQFEAFALNLKTLWANVFQSHRLYVLQHLGLRPEQIHLSVMVQPWAGAKGSGWLKLGDRYLVLEAMQGSSTPVWQGEGWPECYVYDNLSLQASRQDNTFSQHNSASIKGRDLQTPLSADRETTRWLSEALLASIWSWRSLCACNPNLQDQVLTWVLPDASGSQQPQILGIAPNLPLPPPRQITPDIELAYPLETDLGGLEPNGLQCLGVGLAAAPGLLAAPAVVVRNCRQILPADLEGAILVTSHLDPIDLPWFKAASGLICESGGIVSHAAIMGREFGCPVIVGVAGILDRVQTGQWLLLNGHRGEVYAYSSAAARSEPLVSSGPSLVNASAQPGLSTYTQVLANLSRPIERAQAQLMTADGVGLVRGEWLLLGGDVLTDAAKDGPLHPMRESLQNRIRETLQPIVAGFAPRPVYYRAADLRASEWAWLRQQPASEPLEHNPDLGLRGTLRHSQDGQLFEMELTVLKTLLQAGDRNLRLILPYVRSPQEVRGCLQTMQAVGLDPRQDLPLWIMAEVPSVAYALEDYKDLGIQGIAIGLNDLMQLVLGVDRNHPAFAQIWDQNRFVVETAVKQLVQRASALDLPCLLYGSRDILNNEAWLESLIRSGLSGISVNLDEVIPTRRAIAQAERRLADDSNFVGSST